MGWWPAAIAVLIGLSVWVALVVLLLRRAGRTRRELRRWRRDIRAATSSLRWGAVSIRARRSRGPGTGSA
jgi:cytochrome c biogenesis protein CcdA